MNNFQDFNVVDIGHGNRVNVDPKVKHREALRKGNTDSFHKMTSSTVSKSLIESTEAKKIEYCDGKEIIKLRTQKKLSQKELANQVNQKAQVIQQLEQGKLNATPANKILYNKIKQRLR
tara:strand:+ start:1228 stop:1584 length:357 start_codon:yes stop_codon:yes gene_type:complete